MGIFGRWWPVIYPLVAIALDSASVALDAVISITCEWLSQYRTGSPLIAVFISIRQLVATTDRARRRRRCHFTDHRNDCPIICSMRDMPDLGPHERRVLLDCKLLRLLGGEEVRMLIASQLPLGSLFPLAIPLASPLYANALLTTLNSCVRAVLKFCN